MYVEGTDTDVLGNVNVVNKTYQSASDIDSTLGSGDGSGDPSANALNLNADFVSRHGNHYIFIYSNFHR